MRQLLVLLAALAVQFGASAQTRFLSSAAEARKVAEGIVASLAAGNYSGAWKEIRPLSVFPPIEFEAFEAQFNSRVEDMLRRVGSPTGYELMREEPLGTSLVRYQFLVRHEKAPLRWSFVFYRAEKGWVITDFNVEGNASALFRAGG